MGYVDKRLQDAAMRRSPFLKINIGEKSTPLVYKSWKEVVDNFGNDTFRYIFEMETETGFVQKTLDNGSQSFANQMAKIPFGSKVCISRLPKKDKDGNIIPDKSVYVVLPVTASGDTEVSPPSETPQEETEPITNTPDWAKEILDEE